MLKTQVELVTGFIGSGKTTFISSFLRETSVYDERIVVLQLEKGQEELVKEVTKGASITYLIQAPESVTLSYLNHILMLYSPNRLIIECNGMGTLDEIFTLLNDSKVKKRAFIGAIFNLVEASAFKVYWQNLQPLLMPALIASDMIIVTRSHLINKEYKNDLQKLLEEENEHAHILFAEDKIHMEQIISKCTVLDKGWLKVIRIKLSGQLKKIGSFKGEKV